jgi:hypothetical protein
VVASAPLYLNVRRGPGTIMNAEVIAVYDGIGLVTLLAIAAVWLLRLRKYVASAIVSSLLLASISAVIMVPKWKYFNHNHGESDEIIAVRELLFERSGERAVREGAVLPDVLHIVNENNVTILSIADIIFDWDGHSKFGNTYAKHNDKWYASGGFIGNVGDYIRDELKVKQGVVVFVKSGPDPFNQTKYGPYIAESITRGEHDKRKFYYVEKDIFGAFPKYRDYFDEGNVKIIWNDY